MEYTIDVNENSLIGDYYLVSVNNRQRGILTYSLLSDDVTQRDILLIDEAGAEISEKNKEKYLNFCVELDEVEQIGSYGKVKSFVVNMLKNKANPEIIPVVHKFGPVPAFDTGDTVRITNGEYNYIAKIAIYHHPKGINIYTTKSAIFNKEILLESLDTRNMKIVFRRYFQDVSSVVYDIVHNSNISKAFELGKKIENIIGESIKSKQDIFLPTFIEGKESISEWDIFKYNKTEKMNEFLQKKRDYFIKNRVYIYTITYFRYVILYLLNCMYAILGVSSRRNQYLEKLSNFKKRYIDFFGKEIMELIENNSEIYRTISLYMRPFFKNDINSLNELYQKNDYENWLQPIIDFIRLLYWNQKIKLSPKDGRIFISYKYENEKAIKLRRKIINEIERTNKIIPLYIEETNNDLYFRDIIRAKIWQADKIHTILIIDKDNLKPNDISWLCSESEYGINQNKRVFFIMDKRIECTQYAEYIKNADIVFLSKGNRKTDIQRKNDLVKELLDHTHFACPDTFLGGIQNSGNLDKIIVEESHSLKKQRDFQMIKGLLGQFPQYQLVLFYYIYQVFKNNGPMNKKEIEKKINNNELISNYEKINYQTSSIKGDIEKFLINCKNRSLCIDDKSCHLIYFTQNKYVFNVNQIFKTLDPTLREDEIMARIEELMRGIENEIRSSF
jgi:hypothetical protein